MIKNVELFEKLKIFEWLQHKKHFLDIQSGTIAFDSSRGQGRILALLATTEDGLSTKELSLKIGSRVSSINELLSKMESKGLIIREPLKEDKRIIISRLTDYGRQTVPEIGLDFPFFDCLDQREKEEFSKIMDKVNQCFINYLGNECNEEFEIFCKKRKEAMEEFLNTQKEDFFPPLESFSCSFPEKTNLTKEPPLKDGS